MCLFLFLLLVSSFNRSLSVHQDLNSLFTLSTDCHKMNVAKHAMESAHISRAVDLQSEA
jgi:hypothetical protein